MQENKSDFGSKRLDSIYNGSHHVDVIGIKNEDGNNAGSLQVLSWDKDKVDPFFHHALIHPLIFWAS